MGAADSHIDFLQFWDVLRTSVSAKTKRILVQLGSVTGRTIDGVNAESWGHVGFVSRPPKPVAGKTAARCVAIRRGNIDAVIATEDDRGLELAGDLAEGETCLYAAGTDGLGQARTLYKADGSIHHYTRQGNTANGAGMTMQLNAQTGGFNFVDAFGNAIQSTSDGLTLTAGSAALTLKRDGTWELTGTAVGRLDGEVVAVGNPTNPVTDSVVCGPTGVAAAARPKLQVGAT